MKHIRGRPLHPQTQSKIKHYQRSMKNIVKLDNYFNPKQIEEKMKEFVQYYNYESLKNVTLADVYFGTAERKLRKLKMIKNSTLNARKKQYQNFQLNNRKIS